MRSRRSILSRVAPPVAVLLLFVALWQVCAVWSGSSEYLLPRPGAVLRAFVTDGSDLAASLGWTALAAVAGFAASGVTGVAIAIALSGSITLRRAFYPYTLFFQTVPIVAIAPMLVFWLGFGLAPVAACAFIVSVFPVIANTLAGMLAADPALVDLFRLHGASRLTIIRKLRLPSALPDIFTGLRIAAGLAVIGTVVAEFLVGRLIDRAGLGVRIVGAIHEARTDLAFAAVLLASLLGLAMFGAVNCVAALALRRRRPPETP